VSDHYQTLYRKYRPQVFAEVVGQELIVRALKNSVAQGRIAHSYLFAGPRGLGKTSLARIFAKAINCPNVKEGEPCGECHVCTSIAEGSAIDVHEFDAASHRSVEEVQEILLANLHQLPAELAYKVYIIDEVHMISRHAFNSLLKIFEEPPRHVVFILCTTEPDQIPITIRSRCLSFLFRRVPQQALAAHLRRVAEQEGVSLAPPAAELLARLAEGSVRDALSLLEQVMGYGDGQIDRGLVREVLGVALPDRLAEVYAAICRGEGAEAVAIFKQMLAEGMDPDRFLYELAEVATDYLSERQALAEELGEAAFATLDGALSSLPPGRLVEGLEALWEVAREVRYASHSPLLVEMLMLRLAEIFTRTSAPAPAAVQPTAAPLDKQAAATPPPPTTQGKPAPKKKEERRRPAIISLKDETTSRQAPSEPSPLPPPDPHWIKVLDKVREISVPAWAILASGALGLEKREGKYYLLPMPENDFAFKLAERESFVVRALTAALGELGDETPLGFGPPLPRPKPAKATPDPVSSIFAGEDGEEADRPADAYPSGDALIADLIELDPGAKPIGEGD